MKGEIIFMKNKNVPVYFLAVMVWFGFHCGAGMASGTQTKIYVAKYGVKGFVVPFIAWLVNCTFTYIICEYSRLIKAKSYKDVGLSIYSDNPVVGRAALLLWDVLIFMSSITMLGTSVAGCGAQFNQMFGIPYWMGCAAFIIIMVVVLSVGKDIMGRLGKLSVPMTILFFTVCTVGIVSGFPHLVEAMTTGIGKPTVENVTAVMLFKSGFTYGLVQLGSFQALTVMAGKFEEHIDTVKFIILGFVLNTASLLISYLSLMAYYPDILDLALPALGIIQNLIGVLHVILIVAYNVVLLMAYITTAGGMVSGAQARYLPLVQKKIRSEMAARVAIVIFFFGSATALSTLGLEGIITTIYAINSAVRLPVWYIPVLILGPFSIRRVRKAQVS